MKWFALLCLGLAGCSSTHGPQRPHRTGLWGEFGGGVGRMRMSCAGPECRDPINKPGATGLTRVGGTLSDHVMLGGESAIFIDDAFGFTAGSTNTVAELETVGVVVLWFPGRSGFFLKGGVGLAEGRFTISNGAAPPDSTEGIGIGMTFGVGWDVPISRKFAFTANASTIMTAIGDIVLPTRRIEDVIGSMVHLSVAFTFR